MNKLILFTVVAIVAIGCAPSDHTHENPPLDIENKVRLDGVDPNPLLLIPPINVPADGTYEFAVVKGQFPDGTDGGSANAGTFKKRLLTKLETAGGSTWISLDNSEITLAKGSYLVKAYGSLWRANYNKMVFYNIDQDKVEIIGLSSHTYTNNHGHDNDGNYLSGIFEIATRETFELRHYIQTNYGTNTQGLSTGATGENFDEVHTIIEIMRLAD